MARRFRTAVAVVIGTGVVCLAADPAAPRRPGPAGDAPAKPAAARPAPLVAVFNMAAVMKDFGKAKYQVYLLNKKRIAISGDVTKWRTDYIETQKAAQQAKTAELKEQLGKQLADLARKIEDEERRVNKALNDEASEIIAELYDAIKAVVDKTAEAEGYDLVFAYPDAVTPEDAKNPFLKELKLKPPAAQPFYVGRRVDLTADVVRRLNEEYPPLDADGKPVDVSKLPPVEPIPKRN